MCLSILEQDNNGISGRSQDPPTSLGPGSARTAAPLFVLTRDKMGPRPEFEIFKENPEKQTLLADLQGDLQADLQLHLLANLQAEFLALRVNNI